MAHWTDETVDPETRKAIAWIKENIVLSPTAQAEVNSLIEQFIKRENHV